MFGRGKNEEKLFTAALTGDVRTMRDVLRSKTALLSATATRAHCKQHGELHEGDTLLHVACRTGQQGAVKFLLSLKAPVAAVNSAGSVPLHDAAAGGHHEAVAALLEAGANAEAEDPSGRSAMHLAARAGSPEAQQLLVDRGAAVDASDG